jgi:hypothetical protein
VEIDCRIDDHDLLDLVLLGRNDEDCESANERGRVSEVNENKIAMICDDYGPVLDPLRRSLEDRLRDV